MSSRYLMRSIQQAAYTRFCYFFPSLLLLLLIIFEFFQIYQINDKHFLYSLDDPYIHLSLAKHIAGGEYSLGFGKASSPSSSILWPFLLTPFSFFSFFPMVPFFLNILFSFGCLWTFIYVYLSIQHKINLYRTIFLFCLFILALNIIGLIFSGMEHALQVLLSVLLMAGLIFESRNKQFPLWLALVCIAGPLVRYENLALSFPALLFLFYRGHRQKSLSIAGCILLLLGGFSLFLLYLGQPILPASILSKSQFVPTHSLLSILSWHINYNLMQRQAIVFIMFLGIFLAFILFSNLSKVKKQLLMVICLGFFLQLLFGRFDFFYRYELYLYASAWLLLLYLYSDGYHTLFYDALFMVGLAIASFPYIYALINLPAATNNIYNQQYQMRQFTLNWLKEPIAANDIGWLSLDNPYPVIDLWGLGDYQLFKTRTSHKTTEWMNTLLVQSQVKLVMIYQSWFSPVPKNWSLLGCLSFSGPKISAAQNIVHFYATNATFSPALLDKLNDFTQHLPKKSRFDFKCDN